MTLPDFPERPRATIVIRTYNEERHLPHLLTMIGRQGFAGYEVLVVDSGSTDNTVEIAGLAGARLFHLDKAGFTFGRSLNAGCREAHGEFLIFVSGHCFPLDADWLGKLLAPFENEMIGLSYGRQIGGATTKFSEHRHFAKTFPTVSAVPQNSIFCNNANCAIRRKFWEMRPFNETLTGLEDLDWARWLSTQGRQIAYVAEAAVEHLHDEKWSQVYHRYQREAIALRAILPDMKFSFMDFLRLWAKSCWLDGRHARREGKLNAAGGEIVMFRLMQYWGTYRGHRFHKSLTQQMKEQFFYPR